MPTAQMQEGRDLGRDEGPSGAPPGHGGQVTYLLQNPVLMLGKANYLGTRQEIETELDVIAVAMRSFHVKQPDQVMREIAAYTARLTELCVLLHRVESRDRQYTRLRTMQVERFIAEMDRQFKIASRMVEVMRQDLQVMGGHP